MDALLVHDAVAQSDIVVVAGSGADSDHQRTEICRAVHDGNVDVGGQLLLGSITEATLLQGITQFQCVQDERHRLLEAERCRDGQLRVSREVVGLIHTIKALGDVRLGTIDDVVGSFHH